MLAEQLDQRVQAGRSCGGRSVTSCSCARAGSARASGSSQVSCRTTRRHNRAGTWAGADSPDAEVPGVQVHVLALERKCFPLTELECEGHNPPRAVTELGCLQEQALHLLDGVQLFLLESRSPGDLGDVPGDMPAPPGFGERHTHGAVRMMGRPGLAALALHLGFMSEAVFSGPVA